MRELHPLNNKELRESPSKLDASVFELAGSKAHWYSDMSPLQKQSSTISIGYPVLMLHSISSKGRDMKTTTISTNINLLRYLIPHRLHLVIFLWNKI